MGSSVSSSDNEIGVLSAAATKSIEARSRGIEQLDSRFAYFTSYAPLAMSVLAVALVPLGLVPGVIEAVLFGVMYVLVMIGLEVGFHRCFAHRAFVPARPVKIALAILGSMAFQGPVIWWAATHRRHHRHSDTEGDPHSPLPTGPGLRGVLRGLYEGHTGWTFDKARARPDGWQTHAKELYADPDVFKIHYVYFHFMVLGLVLPAIAGALLHQSLEGALLGLLWGGFVRVFIGDHSIRALNSVSHVVGTRGFQTGDESRNNFWLALPTMGQGWHHNHHAFPSSATTSVAWWQLDPGYWVIRGLQAVGLVTRVKMRSRRAIEAKRIGGGGNNDDDREG